ncbi:DNA repair protein RadC [Breznakibacter xylanolyticus]|uniref:DNA repair protein RadC n=1 Tax=Breznakibacter xylanolyticus TaxID=990 RepID=A0A2W7N3H5_9BACT|nr:DNA repair protein RadC [Breznakibacter xylanolyticus]MBN2744990.1 DNA repair protein RadC [Marinilabiliaceae bacterium]PZX14995.1 DNA repair protein RadC [Breznakibacter xylanolyticus]
MEPYDKLTIKNWAVEDRPREKLLSKGMHTLSDAELIAILIGSGSVRESAVELSKKILHDHHHNLNELGRRSVNDLKNRYHGIGEAKAISILAALELGNRRSRQASIERTKIGTSQHVYEYFYPIMADLSHEEFWVLLLNRSNKVIHPHRISQGGITGTVIDVRIILRLALENHATSIALCHNHPSGSIQPSAADKEITCRMINAGKIMDILVIDHIIVGENSYFSFADEGMM